MNLPKFILAAVATFGCATAPQPAETSGAKPTTAAKAAALSKSAQDGCKTGSADACAQAAGSLVKDKKFVDARKLAKLLSVADPEAGLRLGNAIDDAEQGQKAARSSTRAACDGGSIRACTVLGASLIGEGKVDDGLKLLERGCNLGDGKACAEIADHAAKASEKQVFLAKSCALKFGPGCYDLGRLIDRSGRQPDAAKAFASGCSYGDGAACAVVAANGYAEGNLEPARKAGAYACQAGEKFGCFVQAMAASRLNKMDEARKVLGELCKSDAYACRQLGFIELAQGHATQALAQFDQACKKGDASSCRQVARLEMGQGHVDEALAMYQKLCDGNPPETHACLSAGLILEKRARKDDEKKTALLSEATARLTRACDGQVGVACLKLGFLREQQKDQKAAQRLFATACKLSEPTACAMIGKDAPAAASGLALAPAPKPADAVIEKEESDCDEGRIAACWSLLGPDGTTLAH